MADRPTAAKPGTADLAALTDLLASLPECIGADLEAAICAPSRPTDLSCADVLEVAEQLGIDFGLAPFTIEQLHLGMEVEAEQRGTTELDLMDEDLLEIGKIAVTNLRKQSDFYTQLTAAHAPGDPPPFAYHIVAVGTD